MGMSLGRCCPTGGGNNYCDYFHGPLPSTNYQYFENVFNPTTLAPASIGDLADCNCYLLACFGRPRRPASSYADMQLTSAELTVLAAWVAAGGKLICTVDYKDAYSGSSIIGRECDATYMTKMNNFLSACGSSLSAATNDSTSGGWFTSTFNTSYPLTTGLTGNVYYDGLTAGGDLTGGTTIFNPNSHMVVAYDEPAGGGLIVCSGSQNILWCNTSAGAAANASMITFHERVRDL